MHIDKKLNLIIPIERGDEVIYVHATPISFETYKMFAIVLGKTFARIMSEGLTFISGPGVCALVLEEVARGANRRGADGSISNWWEGPDGVEQGLFSEMRRLSNFLYLENGQWNTIPLEVARDRGLLDPEEVFEVENQLAFFTVFSHSPPKGDRENYLEGMASAFNLLTTLLNSTEYAASLQTSTLTETSPATRSSVGVLTGS